MALMRVVFIIIFACLFCAEVMLAMQVKGFLLNDTNPDETAQGDILFNIFGRLQEVISAAFFIKADEYYHGGTKHPSVLDKCDMDKDSGVFGNENCHNDIAESMPQKADLFSRINSAINYQPLGHLSGEENREVIPWFYLAVKLDPHNVQAYSVGSYWLAAFLDKPEEALKFLNEGLKNNPRSWVMYREIGDLYFLIKKDYAQAVRNFRLAYLFMDKKTADIFQQRHVLTFLAAAYEKEGDLRQAINYYELLEDAFKSDSQIEVKIDSLKKQLKAK